MVKCQNRAFTAAVASPQCHPTQVSDIPVMLRQFSLQCMQTAAGQNICSFDFPPQLHKTTHAAAIAYNFFGFCLNGTCFLVNTVNLQLSMKSNMFLRKNITYCFSKPTTWGQWEKMGREIGKFEWSPGNDQKRLTRSHIPCVTWFYCCQCLPNTRHPK